MPAASLSRIALEFVDRTTAAPNAAAIQEMLLEGCRRLGFDHLIICDVPDQGHTSIEVQLCTWPQELRDRFQKVHHKHDHLLHHARQTLEPFTWSEVQWDHSKGSPQQQMMDEAAEFGLVEGFVVPVVGLEGDQSCVGLAGRGGRLQDRDRRALHLMCLYAHHAVRRRRRPSRAAGPSRLTMLQRDCLAYTFAGLDAHTIADRVRLSSAEVLRASRLAASRLGLVNPLEAAARATVLGEIRP